MRRLRHDNPPRDRSRASSPGPSQPCKVVTDDERARRRKESKEEAESRGKAIRDAEWMDRFGVPCPYGPDRHAVILAKVTRSSWPVTTPERLPLRGHRST